MLGELIFNITHFCCWAILEKCFVVVVFLWLIITHPTLIPLLSVGLGANSHFLLDQVLN